MGITVGSLPGIAFFLRVELSKSSYTRTISRHSRVQPRAGSGSPAYKSQFGPLDCLKNTSQCPIAMKNLRASPILLPFSPPKCLIPTFVVLLHNMRSSAPVPPLSMCSLGRGRLSRKPSNPSSSAEPASGATRLTSEAACWTPRPWHVPCTTGSRRTAAAVAAAAAETPPGTPPAPLRRRLGPVPEQVTAGGWPVTAPGAWSS